LDWYKLIQHQGDLKCIIVMKSFSADQFSGSCNVFNTLYLRVRCRCLSPTKGQSISCVQLYCSPGYQYHERRQKAERFPLCFRHICLL